VGGFGSSFGMYNNFGDDSTDGDRDDSPGFVCGIALLSLGVSIVSNPGKGVTAGVSAVIKLLSLARVRMTLRAGGVFNVEARPNIAPHRLHSFFVFPPIPFRFPFTPLPPSRSRCRSLIPPQDLHHSFPILLRSIEAYAEPRPSFSVVWVERSRIRAICKAAR